MSVSPLLALPPLLPLPALRATPTAAECHTDEGFNTTQRVFFCLWQMKSRVASERQRTKQARPGDDSRAACVCVSVIVPLRLTSSCGEQPAKTSLRKPQCNLAFAAKRKKNKKSCGMSDIWKHCGTTRVVAVTGGPKSRLPPPEMFHAVPLSALIGFTSTIWPRAKQVTSKRGAIRLLTHGLRFQFPPQRLKNLTFKA